MGLFCNREMYERTLVKYGDLIEKQRICFGKYETLALKHEEQAKEYEHSLQRYEDQLEINRQDSKEIKNLLVESREKIMLKSLENNNEIMESLEKSLKSAEKHNKTMKICVAFLLFFNFVTLVLVGAMGFMLLRFL